MPGTRALGRPKPLAGVVVPRSKGRSIATAAAGTGTRRLEANVSGGAGSNCGRRAIARSDGCGFRRRGGGQRSVLFFSTRLASGGLGVRARRWVGAAAGGWRWSRSRRALSRMASRRPERGARLAPGKLSPWLLCVVSP